MPARRLLVLVILLAAILRVVPIWFGLPLEHARPDEETAIGQAVSMLRNGDPNPHFFDWPSVTFYLFAGALSAASWIQRLLGGGDLTPSTQFLIGRGCVAIAGTATVMVLFALTRRAVDETTAVIAALALAFTIAFVLGTPYAVLDPKGFSAGLAHDWTHLAGGQAGLDLGPGWIYHARHSLLYGLGWPLALAALAGTTAMARGYRRSAVTIGAFCAVLYASLGPGHTVFFRYVLPIVPMACLAAAVAIRRAAAWIGGHWPAPVVVAGLTIAVALPPLVDSAWSDVLLTRTDTRVLAGDWLAKHAKPDDSLYDAGGAYAGVNLADVRAHRWNYDTYDRTRDAFLTNGEMPDWLVIEESPLVYGLPTPGLRRLALDHYGLQYTVRATREPAGASAYDLQDAFFLPITGFRGVYRPGPTVLIYRRGPA